MMPTSGFLRTNFTRRASIRKILNFVLFFCNTLGVEQSLDLRELENEKSVLEAEWARHGIYMERGAHVGTAAGLVSASKVWQKYHFW